MNLDKKNILKIMGILAFAILFFSIINNLPAVGAGISKVFSYAVPFVTGGAIAFVINVPMGFIERHLFAKRKKFDKFRRPIAFIITLLLIIAVIVAVAVTVIPELVATLMSLGEKVPAFALDLQKKLVTLAEDYPNVQSWVYDFNFDWNGIITSVTSWITSGLASTITIAGNAVSGIASFVIGFVFAIYILMQKENLGRQVRLVSYTILPEKAVDKVVRILNLAAKTFSNFLSGQCLEACILGLMFAIVMSICRMPYVALISILIGFTALIPLVGAFIGCFVGAFLILVQDPMQALWFIIIFIVLQQIEGNIIYPKVVGNSVGLPAIWVLVVVTVGGQLMGIMGMLIMIPLSSVVYAVFREFVYKHIRTKSARVKKMFSIK